MGRMSFPPNNVSDQLSLFAGDSGASQPGVGATGASMPFAPPHEDNVRVVHYLGSKLRLLRPIRKAMAELVPPGARICDLFAGSGTVSLCFGREWNITAADIQEYSRVLCNGLLNPPRSVTVIRGTLHEAICEGTLGKRLRHSLAELIEYDRGCLRRAESGEVEPLCDLVERGSLLGLNWEAEFCGAELESALEKCWQRLKSEGLSAVPETVVTCYFGGTYFSWLQAVELDVILTAIHELDEDVRDYFLAAALAVASDVVNSVGKQFAQPIKPRDSFGCPKLHLVRQVIRDRSRSVLKGFEERLDQFATIPRTSRKHEALQADYRTVLANNRLCFDAVYADPPYTRDHYSRYYHVLETMALHDVPEVSTTTIRSVGPRLSRGHYRLDRHQSPFCIKSQAPDAFGELFAGVARRGVPLLVSYSPYRESTRNRPRLVRIDQLEAIALRFFRRVEVRSLDGLSHNKLNRSARNVTVNYPAEVLLLCS